MEKARQHPALRAAPFAILLALAQGAFAQAPPRPLVAIHEVDADAADKRTRAAFRLAFGGQTVRRIDDIEYRFVPVATVAIDRQRAALFSTSFMVEPCHPCSGVNAIHYLASGPHGLRVVGRWFGLGVEGSDGRAAVRWGVSRALSRWPVLYTISEGVWQGCRVSFAALTELRPAGPADVASFPVSYSDVDTGWPDSGRAVRGVLTSAVPDRSFTVRYTGTMRFSETYTRTGGSYRLAAGRESRVPGC